MLRAAIVVLSFAHVVGCDPHDKDSSSTDFVSDTAAETDADADSDADADADSDADADADSDADADADSDADADADSDADADADADADEEPTHDCVEDRYDARRIAGWEVCIEHSLLVEGGLGDAALALLESDLVMVSDLVPPEPVAYLQGVRIWIEEDADWPGGVYHPSAGWLADNGYPTHWAESVQLGNASNYLSWTATQPAIVLHELAHAWHHQVVGYDHPDILEAYAAAMASGIYDSVDYAGGGMAEAYATTNAIEYFAELTEAWFWENDFFAFNREQLIEFDPYGAAVIEAAWTSD